MTIKQNYKARTSIMRVFLSSGLIVLSMMFLIFSVSCQQSPQIQPPTSSPTAGLTPTTTEVEISNFAFVPPNVTVSVGDAVTWTNKDSVTHTVASQDTLFDSGRLASGATFSFTFNQRGTIEYYCTIHPSMKGKVTVK